MISEQQRQKWSEIRVCLLKARNLIAGQTVVHFKAGNLRLFDELLEHNELELAHGELIGLGKEIQVTTEYWNYLAQAAELMEIE